MTKIYKRIGKTIRHDMILIMAIICLKFTFLFDLFLNINLIICIYKVQLFKFFDIVKFIKRFANKKKEMLVLNCNIILTLIINI